MSRSLSEAQKAAEAAEEGQAAATRALDLARKEKSDLESKARANMVRPLSLGMVKDKWEED